MIERGRPSESVQTAPFGMFMVDVRGITKSYGRRTVVENVSFRLHPGEIVGYLGPNGAGKSTTVKMLVGLLKPSNGEIFFESHRLDGHLLEFKRRLGYVPEETLLYSHLSGREYLQLTGRLRSCPEQELNRKIDDLLRLFSLNAYKHSAISNYSKGMKQKIMIIAALLHNPDVLILDEPLSGLDVSTVLVLRSLLGFLAAEGKAILYSSHVLEVVEKICTRVLIIHRGHLVADDSVTNLRNLMRVPSLEEIFTLLVQHEDCEKTANQILDVIHGQVPGKP
jgi:ABC-2 type transport system ATP-binding protein